MRYEHEVWEDEEDGSYTFICRAWPWADRNLRLLSAKSRIIGTFEAGSLTEAHIMFNRFMGFEEYKPTDLDDFAPYPDEWASN